MGWEAAQFVTNLDPSAHKTNHNENGPPLVRSYMFCFWGGPRPSHGFVTNPDPIARKLEGLQGSPFCDGGELTNANTFQS